MAPDDPEGDICLDAIRYWIGRVGAGRFLGYVYGETEGSVQASLSDGERRRRRMISGRAQSRAALKALIKSYDE